MSTEEEELEQLPPQGHVKVVYLGSVAPHWEVHGVFGDGRLIDEFRLKIFPLVLGTGKRLFDGGAVPAGLELVSSQVTSTGVTAATYRTGAEIKYGSFA